MSNNINDIGKIRVKIDQSIDRIANRILDGLETELKKSIQLNFESQGRPEKWPGKYIDDGRAILTGKTARLQAQFTVEKREDPYRITLASALPYSKIQQEGGEIFITPKMRRFFWYQFKETKDDKWKYLALKKGPIKIPARPFLLIPQSDYPRILQGVRSILDL